METIYLDHNATTPTRPEVIEAMAEAYRAGYANPASQHQPGQRARRVLQQAREGIAQILGADLASPKPDRLIFTSGGTEANVLAVLGIARARSKKMGVASSPEAASAEDHRSGSDLARFVSSARGGGQARHLIISAVEHPSVIETAEHLLDEGWRLDTLGVTSEGVVRVERLAELLRPETALVSVMLGNHETGVLEPVAELAAICRDHGVPMHTDAVQVAGKLPINFRALGVSAMSIAAHKFQGPLGIGALILDYDVPLQPILFGGHQQGGLRPGTESVALAVGMFRALDLWRREQDEHRRRLTALRERFERQLKAGYPGLVVNSERAARLPQTSNVAFPGLDGQVLLMALDMAGVACSVGSACSSGSTELSPTLRAMGLPREILAGSLRFSFGATTTEREIDEAVRRIVHVANELRG